MEKKKIRVTESERRPLSDAVSSFITGGLIISPLIDAAFNTHKFGSYAKALKDNLTSTKGWTTNALNGGFFVAIDLAIGALTGKYTQKTHEVTVKVPDGTTLPGEIKADAPVSTKFQEKETARREEAAEHEAQIG